MQRIKLLISKYKEEGVLDERLNALFDSIDQILVSDEISQANNGAWSYSANYAELLSSREFTARVVNDALIGFGLLVGTKVYYANGALLNIFGYNINDPAKAITPDFMCQFATERTRLIMELREMSMVENGGPLEPFIGEFLIKPGVVKFLEIHSQSNRIGPDQLRVCFMLDATEKVETKRLLDDEIRRFEGIIHGTDAGTWEWNILEKRTIINEKWAEIVGYTIAELGDDGEEKWASFAHPEDQAKIGVMVQDIFDNKTESLIFESRLKHRDGHWVWVFCRGRVTKRSKDGQVLVLSGSNIDITETKLAEERLLKAKEQLELSLEELNVISRAKEDFLSIMSHEIRTPLNSVIGLSNLLLRKNPRPDQLEIVKILKYSSDNLLHLVNDILDYNKIQAGKVELEYIRFSFKELLEHVYLTFRQEASDRGIDFQVKADPQIPETLEGDITRLNQIIINLVSNALKFTSHGKVSITASLSTLTDDKCCIKFEVLDTGVGIKQEKLSSIFQPFNQSDVSITRKFGGTGLGLSIVSALVRMFDGRIDVRSVPDKGSVFTVYLNLKIPPFVDDALKSTPSMPFDGKQLHILSVEDVESNQFLVRNLLGEVNMKCTIADSGARALEATLEQKFDVILMDLQMPEMDGYQATEKIRLQVRGQNHDTPIIAFTAELLSANLRAKIARYNIQDVLSKPFEIDHFVEKIRSTATRRVEQRFSFEFYNRTAGSDETKLQTIRELVATDLRLFVTNLARSLESQSITSMRDEIHRIHPILRNLKMYSVSSLTEELRLCTTFSSESMVLINDISKGVMPVVDELENSNNS